MPKKTVYCPSCSFKWQQDTPLQEGAEVPKHNVQESGQCPWSNSELEMKDGKVAVKNYGDVSTNSSAPFS